jgi:hypothetical protein
MYHRKGRVVGLIMVTFIAAALLAAPFARSQAPSVSSPMESIKGATKSVNDLTVTTIKFRANVLGCMFWADKDGTAFWALDPAGNLFHVTVSDLQIDRKIEIGKKCSWLAPSVEGLVVSVPETQEVWLLEPKKFAVKHKIKVPSLERAVCAANLSTAFASNGKDLIELDLKKGKAATHKGEGPKVRGFANPVVSPDGKYLFAAGGLENMNRYGIVGGKAKFEQEGPRIAPGRVDIGIQVSPDSKFVSYPCYPGNPKTGGRGQGNIAVYPVQNIERPEVTLSSSGKPGTMAASSDPKSGKFYAFNINSSSLLVSSSEGQMESTYGLKIGRIKQMLVHPQGGRVLLLGESDFLLVELPKK